MARTIALNRMWIAIKTFDKDWEVVFLAFMQNLEKVFKHRDLQQKLLETKLTQANMILKEAEMKHKLEKEHVSKTSQDFIELNILHFC